MRISDWSSDVCSSDLPGSAIGQHLVDSSGEEIAIIIDVPRMKIDRQVTTRNDGFQTKQDRSDQTIAPPVTAARHAGDRDMVHLPPSDRMKDIHRAFRDAFPLQDRKSQRLTSRL